jgi:hypothetical protein
MEFRKELQELINRNSKENESDTPDYILAEYLENCLAAFDRAVNLREIWHGRPGATVRAHPFPYDDGAKCDWCGGVGETVNIYSEHSQCVRCLGSGSLASK